MRRALVAASALVLLALPLGAGRVYSTYYLNLATWIVIFSLFAAALDFALGYGGLVSFGHAGFFGLGAYAAALALRHLTASLWLPLLLGVAAAAALAALVGWFAVRSRGVYLAMLTFAFAQLFYEVAVKWVTVTGGSDGLPGGARPALHLAGVTLDLGDRRHMYWVVLVLVSAGFLLARRIVASPFGHALVAVRESEARAAAIGIDVEDRKSVV